MPVTAAGSRASAAPRPETDAISFVPYGELESRPNIIVDGSPRKSTVLTLSHWPNNDSPPQLKRDTSTATALAWLDSGTHRVTADAVSNSHFDEDGLCSMFVVTAPEAALAYRELLMQVATAGDFGVFRDRTAARICFTIESFAGREVSPLPPGTFEGCEARRVAALYREMLPRLPLILADPGSFRAYWQDQDTHLSEGEKLLDAGAVTIEEDPALDLAIVRIPEELPRFTARRYLQPEQTALHPFAIHNRTARNRIVRIQGQRIEFQYRYESWVQLASRRPALRVALEGLAEQLNQLETAPGLWVGDAVADISPRLWLRGTDSSGIDADRFLALLTDWLSSQPVAWDPYDWDAAD